MNHNSRVAVEKCKKFIASKGGTFLSAELDVTPQNRRYTYVSYKCAEGHLWRKILGQIACGWCNTCGTIKIRNTVQDAQALATKNSGSFLSKEYVGAHNKYTWQCKEGHEFNMQYNDVRNGSWCPQCCSCKAERACKAIFEYIYKAPFPKIKPVWLMSPHDTNRRLELDGYNEDLKIAFEYNGRQHYEIIKSWQVTADAFKRQQANDSEKLKKCLERNIELYVIPYTVAYDHLYEFIRGLVKVSDVIPRQVSYVELDIDSVSTEMLLKVTSFLDKKYPGSKLTSSRYNDANTVLDIICSKGHACEISWRRLSHHCALCQFCRLKAPRKPKVDIQPEIKVDCTV